MTLNEISAAFEIWYKQNKYSHHTLKNDRHIKDRIFRYYTEQGQSVYSPKITRDFLQKYEEKAFNKGFSHKAITRVRKIASLLDDYYETGVFVWKVNKIDKATFNAHYSALLNSYIMYETGLAKRTAATITNIANTVRTFLIYLQENNCAVITDLSHKMIADYLVYISKKRPKSVAYICYVLRVFSDFAVSEKLGCINISDTIPSVPKRGRRLMPAFSTEEVDSILAAQDRSTVIGKRDFAIFAVASSTGLRCCDIIKLKRTDIIWKNI